MLSLGHQIYFHNILMSLFWKLNILVIQFTNIYASLTLVIITIFIQRFF